MEDDDRDKVKWRRCLKCQKKFRSQNASNRICNKCQAGVKAVHRRELPLASPMEDDYIEDPLI